MAYQRITKEKRSLALALLVEGNTINGICRVLKIGKPNLLRFIVECGQACEDWHNSHFKGINVDQVQLDEQWAYVFAHKERMSKEQKEQRADWGDCWLWAGIDRNSKAVISWRTGRVAGDFLWDLAGRVDGEVDVCTDKLNSYQYAIRSAFFGDRASHVEIDKEFGAQSVANEELKKPVNRLVGIKKERISGDSDMDAATTSHIERFFLTTRQSNKRKARKTLAYSKKWENHAYVTSIHMFVYNMVRKHETLKEAPAVALGIIEKRWSLERVIDTMDDFLKQKEDEEFEKAFASASFQTKPRSGPRTWEPVAPKTPWYLDPESDGPPND